MVEPKLKYLMAISLVVYYTGWLDEPIPRNIIAPLTYVLTAIYWYHTAICWYYRAIQFYRSCQQRDSMQRFNQRKQAVLRNTLDAQLCQKNLHRAVRIGRDIQLILILSRSHPSKSLEALLERLDEELQNLFRKLSLWKQLKYLTFFSLFYSEHPNGIRKLCTTMPWSILPSLAVLWGVCWMFYPPWPSQEDSWQG